MLVFILLLAATIVFGIQFFIAHYDLVALGLCLGFAAFTISNFPGGVG